MSGQQLEEKLRFRQVIAIYGVTNLTAATLNKLFWRVVRNLHYWSGVRTVVSICDGASCNRLFQKMNTHKMGKGTPNTFQPGRAWCRNPFVRDEKEPKIWFMSDPAHWVKNVRPCMARRCHQPSQAKRSQDSYIYFPNLAYIGGYALGEVQAQRLPLPSRPRLSGADDTCTLPTASRVW